MSKIPTNFLAGIDQENIIHSQRRNSIQRSRSLSPTKSKIKSVAPITVTNLEKTAPSTSSNPFATPKSIPTPFSLPPRYALPHPAQPAQTPALHTTIPPRSPLKYQPSLEKNTMSSSSSKSSDFEDQKPASLSHDNAALVKLISETVALAIKNLSLSNTHPPVAQPLPDVPRETPSQCMARQVIKDTPAPDIRKYNGRTNVDQFIEDLQTRFILQPSVHSSDRLKVMVAVEHLEAASDDGTSDAPKEWARLELQIWPALKDNWPAFAEKLRVRYKNLVRRQLQVEERQNLKQGDNTVQWYKQRFEMLCHETGFPLQAWGEEFYKGLSSPIKDKLAAMAFIDRTNYELVTYHAIQFNEIYLLRQREKSAEKEMLDKLGSKSRHYPPPHPVAIVADNYNTTHSPQVSSESKGKISQDIKNYRIANNLCLYDGGNHRTHLCEKLIEKCKKEGRALPSCPNTFQSQPQ